MAKYRVRHTRTLKCVCVVEAETEEAAYDLVDEGEVNILDCDVLDEEIEAWDAEEVKGDD